MMDYYTSECIPPGTHQHPPFHLIAVSLARTFDTQIDSSVLADGQVKRIRHVLHDGDAVAKGQSAGSVRTILARACRTVEHRSPMSLVPRVTETGRTAQPFGAGSELPVAPVTFQSFQLLLTIWLTP